MKSIFNSASVIVCLCTATDERTVRSAIEEGASSVDEVAARCRAGSCCGGCHDTIEEMIDAGGERRRLPMLSPYLAALGTT